MEVRVANHDDAISIQNIYAYYVKNTNITFEYDIPSVEEMVKRMTKTLEKYPYLVLEDHHEIVGYAYASRYQEKKAYDWDCDLTIYLAHNKHGYGYGRMLYNALIQLLQKMNYQNLYVCITHPNEKSEKFHQKMGFSLVGCFQRSGYKFNQWHDMIWMQKAIGCYDKVAEIVPFSQLTSAEIAACLTENDIQENNIVL